MFHFESPNEIFPISKLDRDFAPENLCTKCFDHVLYYTELNFYVIPMQDKNFRPPYFLCLKLSKLKYKISQIKMFVNVFLDRSYIKKKFVGYPLLTNVILSCI